MSVVSPPPPSPSQQQSHQRTADSTSHADYSPLPENMGRPTRLCRIATRVGGHILPVLHGDIISLVTRGRESDPPDVHCGVSASARLERTPERISWVRACVDHEGNTHISPVFTDVARPLDRQLWVRVYLNDISSWYWLCTSAILVLDEVIRSGDSLGGSNIGALVAEIRSLRDLLAVIEEKGCSAILVPAAVPLKGQIETFLWPPDAEMLLWRRLRNRMACLAANITPSAEHLGPLLEHAAATCPLTMMQLSDEYQKKLVDITNRITILSGEVDFAQCLAQLSSECELLSEVVSTGCNHEASLAVSLPRFPISGLPDNTGDPRVKTMLWGDFVMSAQSISGGSNDGKADGMAQLNRLKSLRPHLNILPMYELANNGPIVALVLPFPYQGNLESYLRRDPLLNPRHLLQQASSALAHIHSHSEGAIQEVYLRDTMVSGADALIYDYGLFERLVDQIPPPVANKSDRLPAVDSIYTAPERSKGAPRSQATDVFSFGMTCFHAYLGGDPLHWPPGPGDSAAAAIARGERPDRDEIQRSDFTDGMWQLVQRCWAQDPDERPTMAEVERLLSEMDTTEERRLKERRNAFMTMRIFAPDDEALREYNEAQRKSEFVRETLEKMERQGLKKFITDVMQQDGCPRLTELLQEARAEKEKYSQVRFL